MKTDETELSDTLRKEGTLPKKQLLSLVWELSVPGIISQISSIVMQYIDAAMVGNLGEYASASIGLVASSTWLFGGVLQSAVMGYTVQVAHCAGAGNYSKSRWLLCQSIIVCTLFALLMTAAGCGISFFLPSWLGAQIEIQHDASMYFFVYSLSLPFFSFVMLFGGMLQCSGNMKLPGILNVLMCVFDVLFNFLFIYVLKMGVTGAAAGTAVSMIVTAVLMFYFTVIKSPVLNLKKDRNFTIDGQCFRNAVKISVPMALEQTALCGAQVASTRVVAPLGSAAIAANSFAVTAEAFCYMPGYGMSRAATTLTGQSLGAGRKDYAKSFAWISTFSAMILMTVTGIMMYFLCPFVFRFLTPVKEVSDLGIKVLRIELFAEPLFAASIAATGSLRGAGDTLVPGIMDLASMWGVRLPLSIFLSSSMGLSGVWLAMCIELCFRGIIFLIRLAGGKWLNKMPVEKKSAESE